MCGDHQNPQWVQYCKAFAGDVWSWQLGYERRNTDSMQFMMQDGTYPTHYQRLMYTCELLTHLVAYGTGENYVQNVSAWKVKKCIIMVWSTMYACGTSLLTGMWEFRFESDFRLFCSSQNPIFRLLMHWKAHFFRHFRLFQTFSHKCSHTPVLTTGSSHSKSK